ncbi:casein kinase substrate phosphoprotein PP28 protein [Ceratobasidium sp. AG-Ba]|nr:casein kinase substrate phosphoprotein PP28 protein [Ceratobasidium sp. AG-Ba]
MVRGSGKFKQKRGGGRSFSRDMVLDSDGVASGTDRRANRRKKQQEGEEEDDSEEEEEEEEEEDDEEEGEEEEGGSEAKPEMSRAERKALKKKQGGKQKAGGISTIKEGGSGEDSQDDLDLINPNRGPMKNLSISDINAPRELTRREREAKEAKEAKERYWKLHQAGKTDQAKSDLARLAKIRADREAAAAKRKEEAEVKAAEIEAKEKASKQRRG